MTGSMDHRLTLVEGRTEHYARRLIEQPFEDGSLVVQYRYRLSTNRYDALVLVHELDDSPVGWREVLLGTLEDRLRAPATDAEFLADAHRIVNAPPELDALDVRAYSVSVLNARNQLTEHEDMTRREAYELRDELLEAHPGWVARVRVDRDMLAEAGRLSETWSDADEDRASLSDEHAETRARVERDEAERSGVPAPADVAAALREHDYGMTVFALRELEHRIALKRAAGEGSPPTADYCRLVGQAARLRALVRPEDRRRVVATRHMLEDRAFMASLEADPAIDVERPPKGRYTLVLIDTDPDDAPNGDFAWVGEVSVDTVGNGESLLELGGELYRQIVDLDVRAFSEGARS